MSIYKTFDTMSGDKNKEVINYQIPEINNVQERNHFIYSNKIAMNYYYTDWCEPCKICSDLVAELAKKYSKPGFCMIAKENADKIEQGSTPVSVTGVPCFHFYLNGQFIPDAVITGAEMEQVEQTLNSLLSS
jgi:thiol-disulfide isomerase/thioredoxin